MCRKDDSIVKKFCHIVALLVFATVISFASVACSQSDIQKETIYLTPTTETSNCASNTELSETTEPFTSTIGSYTIEDCKTQNGVYIKYNDESFDIYRSGGYCDGLTRGDSYFYGMYLPDSIADSMPTIDENIDLVVFSDEEYWLTLYPIYADVAVYMTESNDGILGYGRLVNMSESKAYISISYKNHEETSIQALYIDGKSPKDYDAEYLRWRVRPYKGVNSEYSQELWGFKGSSVTLSVVEGTTLKDVTYEINARFYDCAPDHNDCNDEDLYEIKCIPTSQGYATADLSEVPNGRYVILFEYGKYYKASLVTIQN